MHTVARVVTNVRAKKLTGQNLFSSASTRHATQAAGVKEKYLRYERLDSNHSLLDGVRDWLLGDLSRDPRCKTPRDGRTTLKIHTGAVSEHILNWGAVRDTLYGTKYEKYLDD